jgi:hypothetical protein
VWQFSARTVAELHFAGQHEPLPLTQETAFIGDFKAMVTDAKASHVEMLGKLVRREQCKINSRSRSQCVQFVQISLAQCCCSQNIYTFLE